MLTPAQQQLASDNYGLVFSFLKHYKLDIDEWHGMAAIGLCKAAAAYDSSRDATFATCAYFYMWNEYLHYKAAGRKENLNQKQILTHIENPLNNSENLALEDCLCCDSDFTTPEVQEIVNLLNPREKTVLHLRIVGANPETIQNAIGLGRGSVWKARHSMKQKVLAYMEA